MKIFNNIKTSFQKDLPFVAYRKPNEELLSAFFQETNDLFFTEDFSESGFVFAPFDDRNKSVLIPFDESKFIQETLDFSIVQNKENTFLIDETSKESHIKLVENGIAAIHNNQFNKVVLSRKETIILNSFDIIETYKRLLQNYPNAFVYVWFHPKVGLWLGATPETLVKIDKNQFETMALAGTQLYNEATTVNWSQKEVNEQQFVTDYIKNNLNKVVKSISVSEVETVKAGSLLHLKTKITGELKTQNLKLITVLHPTPAVCGMPLKSSKEFILENENYNRSFYTGFFGELNIGNKSELYVNLRCMEIKNNMANIYIGGGITKGSIPEKEWEETVAKTWVMKRVL